MAAVAAGWVGAAAGWGVLGGEGRTSCLLCSCVLLSFAMCSISIAVCEKAARDVKKIKCCGTWCQQLVFGRWHRVPQHLIVILIPTYHSCTKIKTDLVARLLIRVTR